VLHKQLADEIYNVIHIEPGETAPELEDAKPGWTSETEATVGRVMSKLLSRPKFDSARRKPDIQ
jgi:hypothetical protein